MNGIPTLCIKYYAKHTQVSVLELSNMLYKGKRIECELTNADNNHVGSNNNEHTVSMIHHCASGSSRKTKFERHTYENYINGYTMDERKADAIKKVYVDQIPG